ncbi:Polyferredoxin-like protein [Sulfurimonas denitrificans DSM 1251]|uniref:Polyferredoxin-like protein n=1 Tax=Sulfurimonas denitrificans (strain ATCC 33889 / DSM 1251) TaxID=326298 RepID=Q30TX5_SULDN|nr:nitrous oxide reductase accessory protein NosL [Sulfurimonas denitrificans]ABB43556.1 Polyferredoxin-like protein [Sulfurimonas denitrificans DSM 1251]
MVNFIKRDKNDIYAKPILGFLFKNQKFLLSLKIAVSLLFVYALYFGFAHTLKDNTFTTAVFWGIFWSLFMVVSLPTFGRIFCGICPHGFMGKYITKYGLKKTMPKWMQNRYIGVLLLVFGWWGVYYMFPNLFRTAQGTAILFTVMTIIAFVIYFIYKDMSYCKYICPVGTLTRAYSKLSFTWLGTYKSACNDCRTFECATACPYNLKPFTFDSRNSMTDCTLCMDCSSACEAVSFKVKKPSFSLFSKFQVLNAEVWAFILILASISITMSFHHGIGRSNAAGDMIWAKTAEYLKNYIDFGSIDTIGLFAFVYALIFTILAAVIGMFIASKILKKDFNTVFYDLGYSYAPLFILGSIAHSLETFFLKGYEHIVEGFAYGFGFSLDVAPLANRGDGWLHMFGLLKWVAIVWALIILYKRVKLLDASRVRKIVAFPFAASLIIFFLGINMYTGYIFKTYGKATSTHESHGGGGKLFQSVSTDKAILLQTAKEKNSCATCNMSLTNSYKVNHAAKANNEIKQFCSMHCLAQECSINKRELKDFQAVDAKSLKFINAKEAYYVLGSKIKGIMSKSSKFAFSDKTDAINFVKANGGEIVSFEDAYKNALEDFEEKSSTNSNIATPKDTIYISDTNPFAGKKHGNEHNHGGGRSRIPTKEIWPVFEDTSGNKSCLGVIDAELYLLDADLNKTKISASKKEGCSSVSFAMPNNGYYNLFYIDKKIHEGTLHVKTAKYEIMRFNHSNDAIYDKEKMSAHSIKETPFDILRLREDDETFYHNLYSGENIRVQVLLDGEAIEGADVTLSTKTLWSKTLKTDKDGVATFTLIEDYFPTWNEFNKRYKNEFLLTASYMRDTQGDINGTKYEKVRYSATYPSFYYPNSSQYSSYAYGLSATMLTIILSGFAIYLYRARREKPFKEVRFDEEN